MTYLSGLILKHIYCLYIYQVINSYRDNAEAYSDERKTKLLASVQCEHTDQGELSRV